MAEDQRLGSLARACEDLIVESLLPGTTMDRVRGGLQEIADELRAMAVAEEGASSSCSDEDCPYCGGTGEIGGDGPVYPCNRRGLTEEVPNQCEHGDHPAPKGKRFCSEECARCEVAEMKDAEAGICAGICYSKDPRGDDERWVDYYFAEEEP